ncbi:glucosyltransferase [Perkinsus olseni]|nr:glucosyltransferase [Perkinsus olseni]
MDRASVVVPATVVVVLLSSLAVHEINSYLPDAYMDEIFHVPQTKAFCEGHFGQWDNHITTLPGLYLWAAATLRLIAAPCTTSCLRRFVSIVPTALTAAVVASLVRRRRPASHEALRVLIVLLYPTTFFYNALYYTDTASTALVVSTLYLHMHQRYTLAGLVGAASVFCRQTNIVWLFGMALHHCLVEGLLPCVRARKVDLSRLLTVVVSLWTYIITALGFIAFILYNGAVVVGHKENHVASWHWAQIPYSLLTVTFFMGPAVWLSTIRSAVRAPLRPLMDAGVMVVSYLMLLYGTIVHPFLLADNRHFTFYLWRHVLSHPTLRLGVLPVAVATIIRGLANSEWLTRPLRKTENKLAIGVFVLCCVLALVPSPLLELRYFNIPAMGVLLVYVCYQKNATELYVTAGWMAAINLSSLWIFTRRPFLSVATGELERFMW